MNVVRRASDSMCTQALGAGRLAISAEPKKLIIRTAARNTATAVIATRHTEACALPSNSMSLMSIDNPCIRPGLVAARGSVQTAADIFLCLYLRKCRIAGAGDRLWQRISETDDNIAINHGFVGNIENSDLLKIQCSLSFFATQHHPFAPDQSQSGEKSKSQMR